jgi:hypothetical protein
MQKVGKYFHERGLWPLYTEVWLNFPNMMEELGYKISLLISLSVIIKLPTKLGRCCLSNKTELRTSFIYLKISTTEIGLLYCTELYLRITNPPELIENISKILAFRIQSQVFFSILQNNTHNAFQNKLFTCTFNATC